MTGQSFSRPNDFQFGSFHYALGLTEFTLSPEAQKAITRIRKGERIGAADGDDDTLLQLAHEVFSLFHEMRHFVDTFGTLAGWSVVNGHVEKLQRFASASEILRKDGMHWNAPLAEWAAEASCPAPVREFIRDARAFYAGVDLLISPFEPIEIDGHREDLLVELDYALGGKTDAFPLRVGVSKGKDGEVLRTVLFPIGLEALTEGTAHALSRTLISHYFPASVAERMEFRSHTMDVPGDQTDDTQLAATAMTPYMVVDLMISRIMRSRGISSFSRDLILASVDRVLSCSNISVMRTEAGTAEPSVDRTGRILLDLLQSEESGLLREGCISANDTIDDGYQFTLAALALTPDWNQLEDDGTLSASLRIWETFLAKTYMLPLTAERIASKGCAFTKHGEFLKLISRISLPPARVLNGKLLLAMPERVQEAWWSQLMVSEILDGLLKHKPIFCPRAFATLPGLDTINLASQGTCDIHMRNGCGTFRPGKKAKAVPNCLFEKTLSACALERLQPTKRSTPVATS